MHLMLVQFNMHIAMFITEIRNTPLATYLIIGKDMKTCTVTNNIAIATDTYAMLKLMTKVMNYSKHVNLLIMK